MDVSIELAEQTSMRALAGDITFAVRWGANNAAVLDRQHTIGLVTVRRDPRRASRR